MLCENYPMAIADGAAMPPKAFVERALGLPNVHLNVLFAAFFCIQRGRKGFWIYSLRGHV